jgi:uncharacterized membrane protein YecN with MAPEG domain
MPFAVALMAIHEINGGWHPALHAVAGALVAGRVLQSRGMWATEMPTRGRQFGQSLTWLSVAVLAVLNLWQIAGRA